MKLSKKVKIITVILIFIVLAAAAIFAIIQVIGDKKANIVKILPDEADVRIQDFVYTDVGQDNIQWEVKAKSAQYQKKQNLALFDQVQMKLTTKDGKAFIMTGDKGEMLTDKKDVEIKGHVVITSDTGDKVLTDSLRYSDAQKKIYTADPVVMENKRMKLQGVGLTIFMNKGELTLSSGVKATIN
jgi:LPS export ABC transporter protein LptC